MDWNRIGTWVGRIVLAGLFFMTGGHKLTGDSMMVDMFAKIGLGQGFRFVTGIIEIAGAALLVWPRTSFYAACVLTCVMVGAFVVQGFVIHGDVIHTVVIGAATAALAFVQRRQRFQAAPGPA